MDRSNLQQVNMLYGEVRAIDMALQGFNNGGRIVQMSVSPGPLPEDDEAMRGIMTGIAVDVSRIDYPPQMVESIRISVQQRLAAINTELQNLGVTGE